MCLGRSDSDQLSSGAKESAFFSGCHQHFIRSPETSLVPQQSLSHDICRLLLRHLPRCRKLPSGSSLLMTRKVDSFAQLCPRQCITNMLLSHNPLKSGVQRDAFGDTKPFLRGASTGRPFRQISKTMAEANGASANGKVIHISAMPIHLRSNAGESPASRWLSRHGCRAFGVM